MARVAMSPLAASASESRDRAARMAAVAGRFGGWRPAAEVLVKARGVPTIFPWVNRVTRVLGWPTDRVGLVHGPSNNGKSQFVLGLGGSFLAADHFFAYVDAEFTTPIDWVDEMLGPLARHPGFTALRPRTYEETVDAVRSWAETIGEAKARGELDPDTTGICVVDSIKKLCPKKLLSTLMKEGADAEQEKGARKKRPGGVDGMAGRAAMYKAALNSQWMDELVPLMAHCGTTVAIIAREYENDDSNPFAEDYRLGGGRGLFFDSSIVARVLLEGQVWDGEGKGRRTLGERHRVEIRKTKVGGKEERTPRAWFHTSNGVASPAGFDGDRDLLDVAVDLGVVGVSGSHYSFDGERLGQGERTVLALLRRESHGRALVGRAKLKARVDEAIRKETEGYRSGNGSASSSA